MNKVWKQVVAVLATNRLTMALTGWGSWLFFTFLLDNVMYFSLIGWQGPLWGGGLAAGISILVIYFSTKALVASEKDWFSMKTLHKIQRIVFCVLRLIKRLARIGFILRFIDRVEFVLTFSALTIVFDPIITVLYFRRNDKTRTLSGRDLKFMIWSAVLANIYWVLRCWGFLTIFLFTWNFEWSRLPEYLVSNDWASIMTLVRETLNGLK